MTKIYQENNQQTQATYKLDTGGVEILQSDSPKHKAKGEISLENAPGLQRNYSAGALKIEEVPENLPTEEREDLKEFNDKMMRAANTEIIRVSPRGPSNDGSLLRLFKCQYFNIHMLMTYLETRE